MRNLLLLLCISLFIGCSAPQQQAGGSDLPNGYVSGIVITSEGSKARGASMKLSSVRITNAGDSVTWSQEVSTDDFGVFQFSNVEEGTYILTAKDTSGEAAIYARIRKGSESLENLSVKTAESVYLRGRVISDGNLPDKIFLPGTDIEAVVSSDGFYTLNDVPRGEIELTITDNTAISILQLDLNSDVERDTLFVFDCEFNATDGDPYDFHEAANGAMLTYPELYFGATEPAWYDGTDFSGVNYQDSSIEDPRELWQLPVLVEVTPATVLKYGSMDSVKTLVNGLFTTANGFFSDSRFVGRLHFSPDAIQELESSPPVYLADPGQNYSLRVIFDGFKEIAAESWNESSRTAVIDYHFDSTGGTFGSEATNRVIHALARSRGVENLADYYVKAEDNPVNNTAFDRSDLCLWGKGGTELDTQSLYLINANEGTYKPSFTASNNYPKNLEVVVTKGGAAQASVQVVVYGVYSETNSVEISPRYDFTANSNGVYLFPENPFTTGDFASKFNNFLIEVTVDNLKYYKWMPRFEVQGSYMTGTTETYTVNFTL